MLTREEFGRRLADLTPEDGDFRRTPTDRKRTKAAKARTQIRKQQRAAKRAAMGA